MKIYNQLEEGKIIGFGSNKKFKYIKPLGNGGTGDTHLFYDDTIDMYFAIKKFNPKGNNNEEQCYSRFVEEIKILFQIAHPNIVRIYNQYLYPEIKIGYIQMEYVDGVTIDNYTPNDEKDWNNIFKETIQAFDYLENHNIMHRDIRAKNIMISKHNEVKIIDFGFGKKVTSNNKTNSVILNWPVSQDPEEVILNREYNYGTEIYYLGKLFCQLTKDDSTFYYNEILKKMTEYSQENRYKSFNEIVNDISNNLLSEIEFTKREKKIYTLFADQMVNRVIQFNQEPIFERNIEKIINDLGDVLRCSALEEILQNNSKLLNCFIKSSYKYKTEVAIKIDTLKDFYKEILNVSFEKREIIIENIYARFSTIKVEFDPFRTIADEELPF